MEPRAKLAQLDPVWTQIRADAEEAIAAEPLLGGLIHSTILHHATLDKALALAQTVEELAALYLLCLGTGSVPVLAQDEIDTVLAKYTTYGQQRP